MGTNFGSDRLIRSAEIHANACSGVCFIETNVVLPDHGLVMCAVNRKTTLNRTGIAKYPIFLEGKT
jgi:hypothetical protein